VKKRAKWTNKDKLVSEIWGREKILRGRGNSSTRKSVNNGKTKNKASRNKLGALANRSENN
jgi:hypothetical protein